MKISKIVAIATLAVAAGQSFNAFAGSSTGTACSGGTAASIQPWGSVGASNADADSFVKTGFTVQCSSNVSMSYNDVSATVFGVVAGSVKGNQIVSGNSNGGAIKVLQACPTTGCTDTAVQGLTGDASVTGGGSGSS